MVSAREQLVQHIGSARLDGVDELEAEDVITGVVVLVRLERVSESGQSLLMLADVDYFSQLGMLHAGVDIARSDDE